MAATSFVNQYYDLGCCRQHRQGADGADFARRRPQELRPDRKDIAALAQKAREGKITVTIFKGARSRSPNAESSQSPEQPIINPPQSGILGMHTIQKRPVAIDDEVVIRPMMYVALSYDHRLIDGREAVRFLVAASRNASRRRSASCWRCERAVFRLRL